MTTSSSRLEQLKAALRGRYDIDRPVGEGGMAVVWLAQDVKHDRRVAVKILRRELGLSLGAERFAREIAIAAKLNHPNIVGVIDSGVVEMGDVQLPYYVMPLVEGPSLRDLLEREGPMSVDEALRLCAEVADALDFAHARGVVHRDVKPGNILIQADHALVSDFGIARAIDVAGRAGAALTTESVVGTPIYMSPEQCRGDEQIDGRSDIYSLGCVLYEMLTGAPPFEAHTPQAVSLAHCSSPVPPLDERRPGLPVSVQALVAKALEKSPGARFATAGEFQRELQRVRTRTSAPTQALQPVPRTGRWWLLGAAVAASLVAALVWRGTRQAPDRLVTSADSSVLVLNGFRGRDGAADVDGARLNDELREALQRVPGLRVIDASDQPDLPADSLQRRYQADWIVKGTFDRGADSVGLVVRMLDARSGRELRGASRWERDPESLRREVVALDPASPFGVIRGTLALQMEERRLTRLEPDTTVLALRRRALVIMRNVDDAYYELGPSRALAQLESADSLLVQGERTNPRGVLATLERARVAQTMAIVAAAGRQLFPDSTALPSPVAYYRRSIARADEVVRRAPLLADGWLVRGRSTDLLLGFLDDSTLGPQALSDLRQANRLDPNRPAVWLAQAGIEARIGDQRAALFSIRRAQEADPLHSLGDYLDYRRFEAELQLERYDSAMVACTLGAERYPKAPLFKVCAANVAGLRSAEPQDAARALRLADSLARLEKLELPPTMPVELRLWAAAILWRAGLADSGDRVYDRLAADWGANVDPGVLTDAAYARMVRGDADSALALSARAVRANPMMARTLMELPRFAPLRREPGFGNATQGIPPAERVSR
ncbi:MAG TPA: protein kinase [Gemmatimonadales bacterium]|nr:protein kinase [Gemmatimonadales bacterium]